VITLKNNFIAVLKGLNGYEKST